MTFTYEISLCLNPQIGSSSHTNCMPWGVTRVLGVTLPPFSQEFILGPKFINPDCYSILVKTQKTYHIGKKENLFADKTKKPSTKENKIISYIIPYSWCLVSH